MATDPIKNRPLAKLLTGDHAERAHTLNLRDIELFAAMSGDVNPVHVGHEFAHNDPFHRVVAHGMWVGAQISAVLGTMLPGPGTISRSQSRAGAIEADKAELIVPVLVRPRANCPEWPPAPWQS
jgi:acyl dehydratase